MNEERLFDMDGYEHKIFGKVASIQAETTEWNLRVQSYSDKKVEMETVFKRNLRIGGE